jgi:hypothetical protein
MLGALLGDAWGIFSYRWTIAGWLHHGTPLCCSTYFEPNVERSTTEKCVVQAGARCSALSARRPSASRSR